MSKQATGFETSPALQHPESQWLESWWCWRQLCPSTTRKISWLAFFSRQHWNPQRNICPRCNTWLGRTQKNCLMKGDLADLALLDLHMSCCDLSNHSAALCPKLKAKSTKSSAHAIYVSKIIFSNYVGTYSRKDQLWWDPNTFSLISIMLESILKGLLSIRPII